MSEEQKKSLSCEIKMLNRINCIFTAPYNLGVCILTIMLFIFANEFAYYVHGSFNMNVFIGNGIMLFSAVAILAGIIGKDNKEGCKSVSKMALVTFIVNLFAIILSKVMLLTVIGSLILTPLAYFCFFLTVKHLYLLSQ